MRVVSVSTLEGFRLRLRFDNGAEGVADLSDLAGRGVMSIWNERAVFDQARVTDAGAVEWPGNIDICGDALYMRATGTRPEELFPRLSVANDA